jgi:hypothetical protein
MTISLNTYTLHLVVCADVHVKCVHMCVCVCVRALGAGSMQPHVYMHVWMCTCIFFFNVILSVVSYHEHMNMNYKYLQIEQWKIFQAKLEDERIFECEMKEWRTVQFINMSILVFFDS